MRYAIRQFNSWRKSVYSACLFAGVMALPGLALAEGASASGGAKDIGAVAGNITATLGSVAKLITAGAYVAGFGLAMVGIMKLKAHKDNPQIPISTGIALLFIGAGLIFLPTIFSVTGNTLFGSSAKPGGVSGVSSF